MADGWELSPPFEIPAPSTGALNMVLEDATVEVEGDDVDAGGDDDDSTPSRPRSASPGWLAASSPASSTIGGGMEGFTGFAMWKSFTWGKVPTDCMWSGGS